METQTNKNGYTFQKNSKGYLITGNLKGEKYFGEISNDITEKEMENFDEKDFSKINPKKKYG